VESPLALNNEQVRRWAIDFISLILECHYSTLKTIRRLPSALQPLIFEPAM